MNDPATTVLSVHTFLTKNQTENGTCYNFYSETFRWPGLVCSIEKKNNLWKQTNWKDDLELARNRSKEEAELTFNTIRENVKSILNRLNNDAGEAIDDFPFLHTYLGREVATTQAIGKYFGIASRKVNQIRNQKTHKDLFVEGTHFHKLEGQKLYEFKLGLIDLKKDPVPNCRSLYLFTKDGIALLSNILDHR